MLTAFSLSLAACGGEDSEATVDTDVPEIDCDKEPIPSYSEVSAFDVCTNCHSSDREGHERNSAPPNLNFDTHDGAADAAPRIVNMVSMGAMPPPSSEYSLTGEQKDQLFVWAECGTPE